MNKILKFSEYYDWSKIAEDFISTVKNPPIDESSENTNENLSNTIKSILDKFGFNMSLVLTFGTGVKMMYPIVANLIENMQFQIKPTTEDIVLLCITCLSIMYLENKKHPPLSPEEIKNKLNAEIQMKFGNPRTLINRLLKCFDSLFLFMKKFPKLIGVSLGNIVDMFAYTAILQPVMNAISTFVGTYDLTPDNLAGNLTSLAAGIVTVSGRTFLNYLRNKKQNVGEREYDLPNVEDLSEIDPKGANLIKEQ